MNRAEAARILGVKPPIEEGELKKTYRRMAIKTHPDHGGDEELFKKVTEAYSVLSQPESRHVVHRGVGVGIRIDPGFIRAMMDMANMMQGFRVSVFNMGGPGTTRVHTTSARYTSYTSTVPGGAPGVEEKVSPQDETTEIAEDSEEEQDVVDEVFENFFNDEDDGGEDGTDE